MLTAIVYVCLPLATSLDQVIDWVVGLLEKFDKIDASRVLVHCYRLSFDVNFNMLFEMGWFVNWYITSERFQFYVRNHAFISFLEGKGLKELMLVSLVCYAGN